MTRLLHDCNDDWGGHSAINDGHDTIALDFYEAYDDALGNVLVFQFVLNGGYNGDSTRPDLRDVLTFKVGAQSITKEIRTADNAAFTGDFDAVRGPFPFLTAAGAPDGERFIIEGVLSAAALGAAPGTKLSAFAVQGYAGTGKADHMPGGYTSGGQTVADCSTNAAEQASPSSYVKPDQTLRGPVQFASLAAQPTSVTAPAGANTTITLTVENLLARDQTATLAVTAPEGYDVLLHGAEAARGQLTFDLAADATAIVHVYVTPATGAASGNLELALTTELGGRSPATIQVTVPPPPTTASANATTTATTTLASAATDGGEAPGMAAIAAVLAALGVAASLSRRR